MRSSFRIIVIMIILATASSALAVSDGKSWSFPVHLQEWLFLKGNAQECISKMCRFHPGTFKTKKGSSKIDKSNHNATYCRSCHNGSKAFSAGNPNECHKCHQGISDRYVLQGSTITAQYPTPSDK